MNSESVTEERVDILQTQFNIICCKYTHYFRYNKGKVLKNADYKHKVSLSPCSSAAGTSIYPQLPHQE